MDNKPENNQTPTTDPPLTNNVKPTEVVDGQQTGGATTQTSVLQQLNPFNNPAAISGPSALRDTGSFADNTSYSPVRASEYAKYFSEGVSELPNIQKTKAENQAWYQQAFNWAVQATGEVVGGTISGLGSIYEGVKYIASEEARESADFSNFIMSIGEDITNAAREAAPIHRINPNKAFDLSDSGWWFENGVSIASTLSMIIPARAVVGGLSWLGRVAKLSDKVGDTTKFLGKAFAGAATMRNAENMRESMNVAATARKDVYERLEQMTPEEYKEYLDTDLGKEWQTNAGPKTKENLAQFVAAKAGWHTYNINSINIVFDFIQTATALKALSGASRTGTAGSRAAAKAQAAAIGKPMSRVQRFTTMAAPTVGAFSAQFTEGIEEIINHIGGKEGEAFTKEQTGKDIGTLDDRLGMYLGDAHTWNAGLWGIMGGVAFSGATRWLERKGIAAVTQQKIAEIGNRANLMKATLGALPELEAKVTSGELDVDTYESQKRVMFNTLGHQLGISSAMAGNMNLLEDQLNNPHYQAQLEASLTEAQKASLTDGNGQFDIRTVTDKLITQAQKAEAIYNKYNNRPIKPNVSEEATARHKALQIDAELNLSNQQQELLIAQGKVESLMPSMDITNSYFRESLQLKSNRIAKTILESMLSNKDTNEKTRASISHQIQLLEEDNKTLKAGLDAANEGISRRLEQGIEPDEDLLLASVDTVLRKAIIGQLNDSLIELADAGKVKEIEKALAADKAKKAKEAYDTFTTEINDKAVGSAKLESLLNDLESTDVNFTKKKKALETRIKEVKRQEAIKATADRKAAEAEAARKAGTELEANTNSENSNLSIEEKIKRSGINVKNNGSEGGTKKVTEPIEILRLSKVMDKMIARGLEQGKNLGDIVGDLFQAGYKLGKYTNEFGTKQYLEAFVAGKVGTLESILTNEITTPESAEEATTPVEVSAEDLINAIGSLPAKQIFDAIDNIKASLGESGPALIKELKDTADLVKDQYGEVAANYLLNEAAKLEPKNTKAEPVPTTVQTAESVNVEPSIESINEPETTITTETGSTTAETTTEEAAPVIDEAVETEESEISKSAIGEFEKMLQELPIRYISYLPETPREELVPGKIYITVSGNSVKTVGTFKGETKSITPLSNAGFNNSVEEIRALENQKDQTREVPILIDANGNKNMGGIYVKYVEYNPETISTIPNEVLTRIQNANRNWKISPAGIGITDIGLLSNMKTALASYAEGNAVDFYFISPTLKREVISIPYREGMNLAESGKLTLGARLTELVKLTSNTTTNETPAEETITVDNTNYGSANLYLMPVDKGINMKSDGVYVANDTAIETLNVIAGLQVGDDVELSVDTTNEYHQENIENAAIVITRNGVPIGMLNTIDGIKKPLARAEAEGNDGAAAVFRTNLVATRKLREAVWNTGDGGSVTTKVTKVTSGTLISNNEFVPVDQAFVPGKYELYYADEEPNVHNNVDRLISFTGKEPYNRTGNNDFHNADLSYTVGAFYALVSGLNDNTGFDSKDAIQNKVVSRLRVANLGKKEQGELYKIITEIIQLMQKGDVDFNKNERLNELREAIAEITAFNKFNSNQDGTVPKPYFKIHKEYIEFLSHGNTKLVRIYYLNPKTSVPTVVIHDYDDSVGDYNTFEGFRKKVGKPLAYYNFNKENGVETRDVVLSALATKQHQISLSGIKSGQITAEQLIAEKKLLSSDGILLDSKGNKVSNFIPKEKKDKTSNLVVSVDANLNRSANVATTVEKTESPLPVEEKVVDAPTITTAAVATTIELTDELKAAQDKELQGGLITGDLLKKVIKSYLAKGKKDFGNDEMLNNLAFQTNKVTSSLIPGVIPYTGALYYPNIVEALYEMFDKDKADILVDELDEAIANDKNRQDQVTPILEKYQKLAKEESIEVAKEVVKKETPKAIQGNLFGEATEEATDTPAIDEFNDLDALRKFRKSNPNQTNEEYDAYSMEVVGVPNLEQVVTVEERKANWQRMFGDNVPFDPNVEGIIRYKGKLAYGLFSQAAVQLSKFAPVGAEAHEAFHVAMHVYLSEEARNKVLAEGKKQYGDLTDREIEERLAEDFRMFVITNKTKQTGIIRNFFNRLKAFIENLLGKYSTERLFNEINDGYFNYQPDAKSLEYARKIGMTMEAEPADIYGQANLDQYLNYMTGIVNTWIGRNPNVTMKERSTNNDLNIRLVLQGQLSDHLGTIINAAETITDSKVLQQYITAGKITASLVQELENTDSKVWSMVVDQVDRVLNLRIEEEVEFEGNNKLNKDWDDRLAYSKSSKESFDFDLKRIIMATRAVKSTKIVDNKIQHEYETENVALLPTYLNFDYVYSHLASQMTNARTVKEMMDRLRALGDANPSFILLWERINADPLYRAKWFANFNKTFIEADHHRIVNTDNGLVVTKSVSNKRYKLADNWLSTVNALVIENNNTDNSYFNEGFKVKVGDLLNSVKAELDSAIPNQELISQQLSEVAGMLGIDITPTILTKIGNSKSLRNGESWATTIRNRVYTPLNFTINGITKTIGTGNPIRFESRGRLNQLAEVVNYFVFDATENSYFGVDGNMRFSLAKPSYITDWFDDLNQMNNIHTINKIEAKQLVFDKFKAYASDPSFSMSNWMWTTEASPGVFNVAPGTKTVDQLTVNDLNTGFLSQFSFTQDDGLKNINKRKGAGYDAQSSQDWDISNILKYLTGTNRKLATYPLLIQSDSGNMWNITSQRISIYENGVSAIDGSGNISNSSQLYQALFNTINQEMIRMKQARELMFKTNPVTQELEVKDNVPFNALQAKYHYQRLNDDGVPILLDDEGKPTGSVFKFANMTYADTNGKLQTLNDRGITYNGMYRVEEHTAETNQVIDKFIKEFVKSQFLTGKSKYTKYSDVVEKSKDNKGTPLLGTYNKSNGLTAYNAAIVELMLNSYITNVEFANFFSGNIAEYKNNKDTNKRAKQLSSPAQIASTEFRGKSYQGMTLTDIEIASSYYDSMVDNVAKQLIATGNYSNKEYSISNLRKKTLPETATELERDIHFITSGYLAINRADAQSYATIDRYKKTMQDYGRWNDVMETAFIKIKAGKDLNKDELKGFMQVEKPFYYDRVFDPRIGKMRSRQIKNSILPLLPQLVKGTAMEKVLKAAEAINVEEIYFESATKVGMGFKNTITDADGNLRENFAEGLVSETYDNARWGLQLDVPSHLKDEQNKLGVQISKILMANLSTDAVYQFDGKTLTGDELRAEYFDLLSANIEDSARSLLSRIGATEVDGEWQINDLTKIQEVLVGELESRGMAKNYIEALDFVTDSITGEKVFNLPLYVSNMSVKFESVLTSLFTNNVTNQKFPGGHVTLASDALITQYDKVVKSTIKESTTKEPAVGDIVTIDYYFAAQDKLVPVKARIEKLEKEYQGKSRTIFPNGEIIENPGTLEYYTELRGINNNKLYKVTVNTSGIIEQTHGKGIFVGGDTYIKEFDFKNPISNEATSGEVTDGVAFVFEQTPELSEIGSPEAYSEYIKTIFPNSKVDDIVYHTSYQKFDNFKKPESLKDNQDEGFYFSKNPNYYTEDGIKYPVVVNLENPTTIDHQTFIKALDASGIRTSEFLKGADGFITKQEADDVGLFSKEGFVIANVRYRMEYDESGESADVFYSKDGKSISKEAYEAAYTDFLKTEEAKLTFAVTFDVKQIHILGSKKDITGFKEFVANNKNTINATGINFRNEVMDRVVDGTFRLNPPILENGRIVEAEALLPAWSKKFFDEEGNRIDINSIPEELLVMIGYRIPTEAKYSAPVIKVVGFLPEGHDSTIILPYELITQTGWDFDVDSFYIMQRSFTGSYAEGFNLVTDRSTTAGRNNAIFDIYHAILTNPYHYVENINPGKFTDPVALKQRQEFLTGSAVDDINPNTRDGQDFFRETNIAGRALKGLAANANGLLPVLQNIKAELSEGFQVAYDLAKYDEAKLRDKYGDAVKIVGSMAIVTHKKLAHSPDGSFTNVNGDVTTDHAAQMLAMILDIVKEGLPYNINTYTFDTFMAMVSTGIDIEYAGMFIRQPVINTLADFKLNNDGILANSTTRPVEHVRRDYQTRLYKMLVKNGTIAQDDAVKRGLAVVNSAGGLNWKKGKTIFLTEKNKDVFYQTKAVLGFDATESKAWTLTELEAGIAATNLSDTTAIKSEGYKGWNDMNDNEKIDYLRNQLQILETFTTYKRSGDAFSAIGKVLNTDKIGAGPSLSVTQRWYEDYESARGMNPFTGQYEQPAIVVGTEAAVDYVFQEGAYSPMGSYKKWSNDLSFDLLSKMFIEYSAGIQQARSSIYLSLGRPTAEKDKVIYDFMKQVLNNKLGWFKQFDKARVLGVTTDLDLSLDITKEENLEAFKALSAANKLQLVKLQLGSEFLEDRAHLLNFLKPKLDENSLSRVEINKIDFSKPTASDNIDNLVIDSFDAMFDSTNPFIKILAEDLLAYNYFTTGLTFSKGSFANYIPTRIMTSEEYLNMRRELQVWKRLSDNDSMLFARESQTNATISNLFMKNNWDNDLVVAKARSRYVRDREGKLIAEELENGQPTGTFVTVDGTPDWNTHSPGNILEVDKRALNKEEANIRNGKYLLLSKLVDGEFKSTLMRRYYPEVIDEDGNIVTSDKIYYYPVSKLGSANSGKEFSTTSLFEENNVPYTEDLYVAQIEELISTGRQRSIAELINERKAKRDGSINGC